MYIISNFGFIISFSYLYRFFYGIPYQNNNLKSVHADYIYHQNKKGKPCEMDLPSLKYDITNNLEPQKLVIYSRYM